MIAGLPTHHEPPSFTTDSFYLYSPKMEGWVKTPGNKTKFNKFVALCKEKLPYGFWHEDWDMAMSMAVSHYICITDKTYAQSIDADAAVGGVMGSRSIGDISYSYSLEKTMADNPAYTFWYQTGFGRALVSMSLNRGYVGMLVAT